MNEAHLHLMINHFPIVGLFLATLVLFAGFLLKNKTMRQTALGIFIFNAFTAIGSYLTGEGAEEILEKLSGINHELIHSHEEAAEFFLIFSILTGLMALVVLYMEWKGLRFLRHAYIVLILLIGASIYAAVETGNIGGQIRHPEIRPDFRETAQNISPKPHPDLHEYFIN